MMEVWVASLWYHVPGVYVGRSSMNRYSKQFRHEPTADDIREWAEELSKYSGIDVKGLRFEVGKAYVLDEY